MIVFVMYSHHCSDLALFQVYSVSMDSVAIMNELCQLFSM